jgi:hypothetical protein
MLDKLFAFILVLAVYFFYIIWFKPRQAIKGYAKQLKDMGYKVL